MGQIYLFFYQICTKKVTGTTFITSIEKKSIVYDYVSKVVDTKNLSKNQLAGLIGKLNLEEEQEEKLLAKALVLKEG
jgi:hypothetical protein